MCCPLLIPIRRLEGRLVFFSPVSALGPAKHTNPKCVDTRTARIGEGSYWLVLAGSVPAAALHRVPRRGRIPGRRVPSRRTAGARRGTEVLGVAEGQDREKDEPEEEQPQGKAD